ncbi:hypothetical protein [Paraliobacillus sp. JSM ZJ581]|uniref:hypothetical protein n=1 Tax=Paraliobacillus sp. JSM ZJ581 TaxID=3342118 RepID=UPI0035A8211A
MNKQEDQAANLREHMKHKDPIDQNEEIEHKEIDVLDLPPRSEIHQGKSKKTRWKINLIFLRFLFLLFIIVIILVITYQYWGKDLLDKAVQEDNSKRTSAETVQVVSPTNELSEEVTIQLELGEKVTDQIELTGRYYFISNEETLEDIAMEYYNTLEVVEMLKRVNQLEAETIKQGEKLFLPTIDEL